MNARKVLWEESGARLARVIDTVAGGSLKVFVGSLRTASGDVPRGGNRRSMIDYKKGRVPIPETVIVRVCQVYPIILPGYLRSETPYMTAADEWDARQRNTLLSADATGTGTGTLALGDIFKLTGVHKGVRESLELLVQLTPGSSVARSPLHDVWHLVCEIERVPIGEKRLKRLRLLVQQVDALLPSAARPSGTPLETFRLGVLAAMLAALIRANERQHLTVAASVLRTPKKPVQRRKV